MFGEIRGYRPLRGSAVVSAFGGPTTVTMDQPSNAAMAPDEAQRDAFVRASTSIGPEAIDRFIEALFQHYQEVAEVYRDGLAEAEIEKRVPNVTGSAEFRRLLSNPRLHLP